MSQYAYMNQDDNAIELSIDLMSQYAYMNQDDNAIELSIDLMSQYAYMNQDDNAIELSIDLMTSDITSLVDYHQLGRLSPVWSTITSLVDYHQLGRLSPAWSTITSLVDHHQLGRPSPAWSTITSLVDYHQLGRLVSESACERKDPGSNPAADMVDAARNTAWDLDQPWTLFVPLNDGLPGPGVDGFLKDKDRTKELILNHLVLGTVLDPEAGDEIGLLTQGGTMISLTGDQDGKFVNGIKVVGDRLPVDGGAVVIIEKYLPLPAVATENTIQTVTKSDAPEVPVIAKMRKVVRPGNARPSPLMVGRRNKKPSRQLSDSEIGTSTTRFEKFKTNRRKSLNGGTPANLDVSTPISTTENIGVTTMVAAAEEEHSTTELSTVEGETTSFETENYSFTEETTTVGTLPSTLDILPIFSSVATTPETEQSNPDSESPFSTFENFIKTSTNEENLFTEIQEDATTVTENIESESQTSTPETLPELSSDFVPLNLFLESENATELELVDETPSSTAEMESMVELSNKTSILNNPTNFLNWLEHEIKFRGRFGGNEFLHHLVESGVAEELKRPQQFTAIIPTDEAFYAFYPIDWGFNPFLVESFLNRTLREHLVEGDVALEEVPDGGVLTTLAGNTIRITNRGEELKVEGVKVMTESETTSYFGRIYSVPKFFHVDHQTVNLLQKMHPHLERAPLLGSPWPMSQFLSHLYPRTGSFAPPQLFGSTGQNIGWDSSDRFHEYLGRSHLSHLVRSFDDESNHLEYTALIPSDLDVMAWISSQPTPFSELDDNEELGLPFIDPFLEDAEEGNRLVGSHILKGRLDIADLTNGSLVTTILNDTLRVTVFSDGRIKVGSTQLVLPGESIYNLGVMYRLRGPLLLSALSSTKPQTIPEIEVELETEDVPELLPRVVTRTEVSVSRQVNNGVVEVVPVASYVENLGKFQLLTL
ncbi:FAS1 domain [Trinorchestia longiramus]|nr:FAS1 domain [Trinorchestia longiramus]